MKTKLFFILMLLLGCRVESEDFPESEDFKERSVRFVYLVSADREPNSEYTDAITEAATVVQHWYWQQMGGLGFQLNDPKVEVVQSDDKPNSWFANHKLPDEQPQANPHQLVFYNAESECEALLGTKWSDPNFIWVIYCDSDEYAGMTLRGVSVMAKNDLEGLCGRGGREPGSQEYDKPKSRWLAGLAHEIGHAFGLDHPAGLKNKNPTEIDYQNIMGYGWTRGLDQSILIDSDKEIISSSPFFFPMQNEE